MNGFLANHVIHAWLGAPDAADRSAFSFPGKKVLFAKACPLSLIFGVRFFSIAGENEDCLVDHLRRFAESHPATTLTLTPAADYLPFVSKFADILESYYVLPKGGKDHDTWTVD